LHDYFNLQDSIYDITEKYPQTVDFFAARGFGRFADPSLRKSLGKMVTLKDALLSKDLSAGLFAEEMAEFIAANCAAPPAGADAGALRLQGVLPCPIRLPLLEKFEGWLKSRENAAANYEFKPASMGVGWIKDALLANEGEEEYLLPDLLLSAGFELFFEDKFIRKYRDKGIFADIAGDRRLNADFDNDSTDLKDPARRYAVLSVVPAVFMADVRRLGKKKTPAGWDDILSGGFDGQVALPLRDLDMFDALLLNIHKIYGANGVRALRQAFFRDMHPAEMIAAHGKGNGETPLLAVVPWFFAAAAPPSCPLEIIWPRDGAIVSPIYLLAKKSRHDALQPFADFFFSRETGEIFSHQGKFPSAHPAVDNRLGSGNGFLWLGWDYIGCHNIGELLRKAKGIFYGHGG
jgi:ABC-type Fe3+ transport system substrate-binding protein